MNPKICAPNKYDDKNQTCFTLEQLVEMASAYNRYVTKKVLGLNNDKKYLELIYIKPDKKYLLQSLLRKFNNVCNNDQVCITKQKFMDEIVAEMREDILNNTFRSNGPVDPKQWLNTVDINNIMKQYEKAFPKFKFYGAVPLNCNELAFCSLYNLDFASDLSKGIEQLGIVFNLDKYGQPGSHWVSLFIDIIKGEIYFCDSNGKSPAENITDVITKFTTYYKNKTGQMPTYKYNTMPYQKDSSECGVYSCNFIIRKLSGEKYDDIVANPLSFKDINSCRNVYFRNAPSKFSAHQKCEPNFK